jgi:hypothetical protein
MPGKRDLLLLGAQLGLLLVGAAAGLLLALWIAGLPLDFRAEIVSARELGIVSSTVLMGYPKGRDVVTYATVFGLPVLLGLAVWGPWAWRRRVELRQAYDHLWTDEPASPGAAWLAALAAIAAAYLIAYFPGQTFWDVMYIPGDVRAWPFIGEEGEILAWVQVILDGGVYGKDFFCLYGPLMLYPLALAMKIFGPSVSVARHYTFALDLIAYAIVIYLIFRTFRSRLVAVVFLLTYLTLYHHLLAALSANTSYLRVASGLLPLVLVYDYLDLRRRSRLVLAGLATSASLLFSQEVGLCSAIAVLAMLAPGLIDRGDRKQGFVAMATYLLLTVAGVVPFLAYEGANGALGVFWESLAGYPRLVMLGFGGKPFPNFAYAVAHPLEPIVFDNYWVLFTLAAAALSLVPWLLLGRRSPLLLFWLSLVVFGALLFRSALGRSTISRAFYVSLPALTLLFGYVDNALTCALRQGRPPRALQLARLLVGIGVIGMVLVNDLSVRRNADAVTSAARHKWSSDFQRPAIGATDPIPRLDVLTDEETRSDVMAIREFTLRKQTSDVVMFPNEPIHYFLLGIRPPTRFVMSYFAVTHDMRLEMVAQLEARRPRYVAYSKWTWRLDNIPEEVQVPEVVDYLQRTYHPIEESAGLLFLERNAP